MKSLMKMTYVMMSYIAQNFLLFWVTPEKYHVLILVGFMILGIGRKLAEYIGVMCIQYGAPRQHYTMLVGYEAPAKTAEGIAAVIGDIICIPFLTGDKRLTVTQMYKTAAIYMHEKGHVVWKAMLFRFVIDALGYVYVLKLIQDGGSMHLGLFVMYVTSFLGVYLHELLADAYASYNGMSAWLASFLEEVSVDWDKASFKEKLLETTKGSQYLVLRDRIRFINWVGTFSKVNEAHGVNKLQNELILNGHKPIIPIPE